MRRQTSLMCSCTPKTSCTTSTTGKLPPVAGIARYAGIVPSFVGTFTSPATSPSADVVIVCAVTGSTASAKPAPSELTTNVRRSTLRSPSRLFISVMTTSFKGFSSKERAPAKGAHDVH